MSVEQAGLIACIFVAAALYSSVGHAGASGYLAAMALFSIPQATMRPSALALNILVALIASSRFISARAFSLTLFLPLVIGSIPFAFLGGRNTLHEKSFKILIAIALLFAAARLAFSFWKERLRVRDASPIVLVLLGAAIGFLAGLTGVGGGIYLTPIILIAGWSDARTAAGVSAAFILVNSISGLIGQAQNKLEFPAQLPYWAIAAVLGGLIGSHIGVAKLGEIGLRRVLAFVLVVAAAKLALG